MVRESPSRSAKPPVRSGEDRKGRHERQVEAAIRKLRAAGLLEGATEHLVTAMRANGRSLDEAEAAGNSYGTRQATRSLLEIHTIIGAVATEREDDPAQWIVGIPDHVPEGMA